MNDKATATDIVNVHRSQGPVDEVIPIDTVIIDCSPEPAKNESFWQRFWKHFSINSNHSSFEITVDSQVDVTIVEDPSGLVYRFRFRDVDTGKQR